jgi:uncharacterized protein DUF3592
VQIVLLIAGLLLLAVGVSIVALEAAARRSGVTVTGRVVGHSQHDGTSGPMFNAVIEFVDLEGRKHLSESAVGSNAPLGRIGDPIQVALQRGNPDRATIESPITYVIGIVVALFGIVSCAIFFTTYRLDTFSVITSIAVALLAGFKLHALIARQGDAASSWRKFKDAMLSQSIDAQARGQIAWANPDALATAVRRQERAARFGWPILVLAGIGLLFLAGHLHRTTSDFLARAVPVPGRVVDLAANTSSDDTTYAAVVEFEVRGEWHRFKDSLGSNPPAYRPGDEVPVRYLPEDPGVARIDRGIWNRALPFLVGAFGALLAGAGLWLGARRMRATAAVPSPTPT